MYIATEEYGRRQAVIRVYGRLGYLQYRFTLITMQASEVVESPHT